MSIYLSSFVVFYFLIRTHQPELLYVYRRCLGYRYKFNKHWALEANAGLGGGFYVTPKGRTDWGWATSTLEYAASLRLGYTF